MTNDEWKIIETALSNIWGRVKLKIDGFYVNIGYVQESVTKYCLAIFINSKFESNWVLEDCEIRRRFCSKHTKSLYEYYTPYWSSFHLLKSHLIKNNTSIELMQADIKCSECKFCTLTKHNGSSSRYSCDNPNISGYMMICRCKRDSGELTIKTLPKWCPLRKE